MNECVVQKTISNLNQIVENWEQVYKPSVPGEVSLSTAVECLLGETEGKESCFGRYTTVYPGDRLKHHQIVSECRLKQIL